MEMFLFLLDDIPNYVPNYVPNHSINLAYNQLTKHEVGYAWFGPVKLRVEQVWAQKYL